VDYETIIYDKPEDGIARITLNRPGALNAFNLRMIEEIYAAADDAASDEEVSVLIYRGAGRAFCSGRDFKERAAIRAETGEDILTRFRGFGPQTWLHPKATIAQVHGYAVGGGNNLAVSCDITIASEDARFGFPEQRYGTLPKRMVWNYLMSPKRVKEYLLTGANFAAEEAYLFGLVNHVVPRAELDGAVMVMARDMVLLERRHPGHIQANKFEINDRNPDLALALDPRRREQITAETEFVLREMAGRSEFDKQVHEGGVRAALDNMHEGYSSQR
jgi:enoyl-CoA hydratase